MNDELVIIQKPFFIGLFDNGMIKMTYTMYIIGLN